MSVACTAFTFCPWYAADCSYGMWSASTQLSCFLLHKTSHACPLFCDRQPAVDAGG